MSVLCKKKKKVQARGLFAMHREDPVGLRKKINAIIVINPVLKSFEKL